MPNTNLLTTQYGAMAPGPKARDIKRIPREILKTRSSEMRFCAISGRSHGKSVGFGNVTAEERHVRK